MCKVFFMLYEWGWNLSLTVPNFGDEMVIIVCNVSKKKKTMVPLVYSAPMRWYILNQLFVIVDIIVNVSKRKLVV